MRNDFTNKAVVITGGTKGIGRAIGLAFGRHGAQVYLTHRWSSADENELRAAFAAAGAPEPAIVEADVSADEDTEALLEQVKKRHDRVEVFVSNVVSVQPTDGVMSYKKSSCFSAQMRPDLLMNSGTCLATSMLTSRRASRG